MDGGGKQRGFPTLKTMNSPALPLNELHTHTQGTKQHKENAARN